MRLLLAIGVLCAASLVGARELRAQAGNTARLTGTVRTTGGAPVPNARAALTVTSGVVIADDSGRFTFENLRAGTAVLQIRALGYTPVSQTVQLVRDSTVTVTVEFSDRVMLPAVAVRARRYEQQLAEFERRRRMGFGHYMTPEQLARRAPNRLAMVLVEVPGTNLVCPRGGTDCVIQLNRPGGVAGSGVATTNKCSPSIYIDGRLDQTGMAYSIYSDQIASVEVYPRESTRPMEFQDLNRCGAIVLTLLPPELDPRPSTDVVAKDACGGRLNWCYARRWLPLAALVSVGFFIGF